MNLLTRMLHITRSNHFGARTFASILAALFFVAAPQGAKAQTYYTWRSENPSGNGTLDYNGNWWNFNTSQSTAWGYGQQEFDNNVQTANYANNTLSTWRILFKTGASSARTFTGNNIRFTDFGGQYGGIWNESSATHVFNNNLDGDGATEPFQINIGSSGGLTFGGTINNQGTAINLVGGTASTTTVTFNGVISGNGGFYKENSNITAEMTAANTYSGDTTIQAGTLKLSGSGSLANSLVRLHSAGVLNVATDTTIKGVKEEGSGNAGTVSISSGKTLTVSGANMGTLYQSSINGSGGNLKLTASGNTVLSLYNAQGYSGTTEVTGGKLVTSGAMSTTGVTTSGSGIFEITGGDGLGSTATIAVNGGEYIVGAADTVGALSGNSASGKLTLNAQLITSNNSDATFAGIIQGSAGNLVKQGSGTLSFSGTHTGSAALYIDNGAINVASGATITASSIDVGSAVAGQAANNAALRVSGSGLTISSNINVKSTTGAGSRSIDFANTSGTSSLAGAVSLEKDVAVSVASGGTGGLSGAISGAGGLTKSGSGSLTVSGGSANTYGGATTVSAGVLNLNKTAGVDAIAGSVTVGSGATLLLSANNQVANTSAVTLSGGTITRASGVSEVFGNLNLTQASFLDFGTGTAGNLSFGTYSPVSKLTINNFGVGNTLVFKSNLSGSISDTNYFQFSGGFTSSWNSGSSTFTITAVPEASTVLSAIGLAGLMIWPSRRRLVRDVQTILGIRRPAHERLASYRRA